MYSILYKGMIPTIIIKTISPISRCRQRFILKKKLITSYVNTLNMCSTPGQPNIFVYVRRNATLLYACTKKLSTDNTVIKNTNDMTVMEKIVDKMPAGIQPYAKLMRLDKPTGMTFLLWPCYWSLAMATPPGCLPDPILLAQFGCGAILMRGAGCTINDLWDKDIDLKVSRTKERPLVCNHISILDAWMFLGGQLSLALLILLQFNWYSIILGASSLFLVTLYPFAKRIWNWPQLVLGLTFNWGALLGWSAIHGSCYWPVVLPLYAAGISWTLIYDTIYAHQDKVDDILINVKSTALLFGDKTKIWLSGFTATACSSFIACGYFAEQTWPYYASVIASMSMFASQISSLNIDDPNDCWQKFKSNQKIGWIIFLGIVYGTLLKSKKSSEHKNVHKLNKQTLLDSNSTLQLQNL